MSLKVFEFGQMRPEYAVPVLNERAVRASAGILFALALVSFMNAWLLGHFGPTRVFVLAFLIEFSLRLFVNPRLAPVMVLGEWMVRQQLPEWTGAPQKRFAWAIGWLLAATMFTLVVWQQVIGPVNLIVCALCLLLLFFESAFGICIGCVVYRRLFPAQARLCPGGVCEIEPAQIPRPTAAQGLVVLVYAALVLALAPSLNGAAPPRAAVPATAGPAAEAGGTAGADGAADAAEQARCRVPEFAKAMGHEAMWKLHNHCP